MDLRTDSTGLRGILASLMEASREIRANTKALRDVIDDNLETKSPARAECEMRLALCTAKIELKRMRSDVRRLEDYMVDVGRRLIISKASRSHLSPPKATAEPIKSDEQVIPKGPCSPPEAILANVDSAPHSPSQPLVADDVHFEREPKVKTVVRRLSRSRTPYRRLSLSASNADDTLLVDK
ncbi:hypothetical protein GCK32_004517 [Trichostrongylus colubriformis]|uniref:Uncharacterized protein n=1 Tax=Trichostrongylus colubriformis TaxID=6319 RepID=A0AAN8INT4_TRICO